MNKELPAGMDPNEDGMALSLGSSTLLSLLEAMIQLNVVVATRLTRAPSRRPRSR